MNGPGRTGVMTYDEVEYILAEIITEATGEPRVGRFERTLAKSALKRLRAVGMTLESADPRFEPDWYDTRCPTCDAPVPGHTPTCAVVFRGSAGWESEHG